MDMLSKLNTPLIGILVTIAFGFWLSKLGKPYNGILFNFHKLIALGTVIVAGLQVYQQWKVVQPEFLLLAAILLTGLCVIALFVSGAFLSIGNFDYALMKTTHNIALVAGVICCGLAIYLLGGTVGWSLN